MPILNDVTEAVGHTPLVRINRIIDTGDSGTTVAAKLEFYNPASSVKDRIGVAIVDAAEQAGALRPGGTIVEATSGNTGIALAMVGAARGYHVVLAMPESMSKERRALLKAYGAELVLTPAGGGMQGAVDEAERIVTERGNAVLARQFANEANPEVHRRTTAEEIWKDTDGGVDILVAGIGTGGTITGVGSGAEAAQARRADHRRRARGVARSSTAASPARTRSRASGRTSSRRSSTRPSMTRFSTSTPAPPSTWARRAAREEGLLVGLSSGAALAAAAQVAARPESAGKTIVVIIPSFGERYLSTVLFDGIVD